MYVKHSWFPIGWSAKVKKKPIAAILNSTPIVLFRTSDQIHDLLDRSPQRRLQLSKEELFGPYLDLLLEGKELPEKEYEVELDV